MAGGLMAQGQEKRAAWRGSVQGGLSGGTMASHAPCFPGVLARLKPSIVPLWPQLRLRGGPGRTSLSQGAHTPCSLREGGPCVPRGPGSAFAPSRLSTHHTRTTAGRPAAGVREGPGSAGGQPRQAPVTEGWVLDSAGGEGPHPDAPTPRSRTFTLALSRQSQEALGSGGGHWSSSHPHRETTVARAVHQLRRHAALALGPARQAH